MHYRPFLLIAVVITALFSQTIVDLSVKGISDGKNDGAQKDRVEAVMDAKRQACEKAGIAIDAKTTVSNFTVLNDYVETQSKGALLPGFQIVDIGYVADGTYQVVLSGKVKTKEDETISIKELRYAKKLNDKKSYSKCREILESYIDSKDEKVPEGVKEEAHYYYLRWGYAFNLAAEFDKFTSYYPQSRHIDALKGFVQFAKTPLCSLNRSIQVNFSQWKKATMTRAEITFDRTITAINDTIGFMDFKNSAHSLVVTYEFYQSTAKDAKTPFAYSYSIRHYTGVIKKGTAPSPAMAPDTVIDAFNPYGERENLKYQSSRGDARFGNFRLTGYQLDGEVPVKAGVFPQKAVFRVYQDAF